MNLHNSPLPPELRAMETLVRTVRPLEPPPTLREQVLNRARQPQPVLHSEYALRWVLAALVVVFGWSIWMEHGTAERMTRLANNGLEASPEDLCPEPGSGFLLHAWLHPRRPLPLPPTCTSRLMDIAISTMPPGMNIEEAL